MRSRLDEARAAFDDARERAERPPDLFTEPVESWEHPASATEEWQAAALELVRQAALTRDTFTVADLDWPATYDARARGAALRAAARKGFVTNDGYVVSGAERHSRPIVRWRSRIYANDGRPSPEAPVNDTGRTDPNVHLGF